jgi:DNA-binding LacI/PurR family transcriptional regulator
MARATLQSLARQLEVSRQTVSNVLNAPERVAPETRDRVEQAIAASEYRPTAAARALRSQRSLTIALRLYPGGDGINGHLMDRFVHCLVEETARSNYQITLFTVESLEAEVAEVTDLYQRRVVDAAILSGVYLNDPRPRLLTKAGVPFAVFGRPWHDDDVKYPWADIDGRAGVRTGTDYLFDAGHPQVGFIGWSGESPILADRLAGWQESARAHRPDLATDEIRGWRRCGEDTVDYGARAMAALLDEQVEAVVCASDSLALGAIETMRQRGAVGPYSAYAPVIGFDDSPVARALHVSSISQPVERAAAHIVGRLVVDLTENGAARQSGPPHSALLTPDLQIRAIEPHISASGFDISCAGADDRPASSTH